MSERDWQGNGWTTYQKLVLSQLEAHNEDLSELSDKISDLRVEISALKIQAGIWGLMAGLIPATIGVILTLISHGK